MALHHHGLTRYPHPVLQKFNTRNRDDVYGFKTTCPQVNMQHIKQIRRIRNNYLTNSLHKKKINFLLPKGANDPMVVLKGLSQLKKNPLRRIPPSTVKLMTTVQARCWSQCHVISVFQEIEPAWCQVVQSAFIGFKWEYTLLL